MNCEGVVHLLVRMLYSVIPVSVHIREACKL